MRMLGRLALLAAALLVVPNASAGERLPPFPKGLYGNVGLGEESGDLGGFEVRFYTDAAGRPMAEYVLCEGWCNSIDTAEVTREGRGFAFAHVEVIETGDGTREERRVSYRLVPSGRSFKVTYAYDGEVLNEDDPWRILPLAKPWGLGVAREEMATAAQQEAQGDGQR